MTSWVPTEFLFLSHLIQTNPPQCTLNAALIQFPASIISEIRSKYLTLTLAYFIWSDPGSARTKVDESWSFHICPWLKRWKRKTQTKSWITSYVHTLAPESFCVSEYIQTSKHQSQRRNTNNFTSRCTWMHLIWTRLQSPCKSIHLFTPDRKEPVVFAIVYWGISVFVMLWLCRTAGVRGARLASLLCQRSGFFVGSREYKVTSTDSWVREFANVCVCVMCLAEHQWIPLAFFLNKKWTYCAVGHANMPEYISHCTKFYVSVPLYSIRLFSAHSQS